PAEERGVRARAGRAAGSGSGVAAEVRLAAVVGLLPPHVGLLLRRALRHGGPRYRSTDRGLQPGASHYPPTRPRAPCGTPDRPGPPWNDSASSASPTPASPPSTTLSPAAAPSQRPTPSRPSTPTSGSPRCPTTASRSSRR